MLQRQIVNRGRPGFKTPEIIVYCTHNNQFTIGPDTFSAQDTLAQVSDNKRISLLKRFKIRHGVKIRLADTQLGRDLPESAPVALAANHTRFRMFRDHQTGDIGSVLSYPG